MKKIAVITATRAEYGLLAPVLRKLRAYENDNFVVELIVTGTHLITEYGYTIKEISADGFRIDHCIYIPVDSETELDISANQAETLLQFTKLFRSNNYSCIIILGDRYEMLSIAIAAGNTRTPIFHLCGGDTTEGAIDEWIRHSITKMSYLHFVTNEESRKRVIQLGEEPNRVFNYGSTSIDNIRSIPLVSRAEALSSIGIPDGPYALCTYHPVTMESHLGLDLIYQLINSIAAFSSINFIITKSNSDEGGMRINEIWDKASTIHPNIHVFSSLGVKRYLSLMKHAEFVIGNSSSGIIETPYFHIPTINIGDRQLGRLQSDSIINCETDTAAITDAIHIALSKEFKSVCLSSKNKYGCGDSSEKIAGKIVDIVNNSKIDLKKKFYDI